MAKQWSGFLLDVSACQLTRYCIQLKYHKHGFSWKETNGLRSELCNIYSVNTDNDDIKKISNTRLKKISADVKEK